MTVNREAAIQSITANINEYGHHVYLVQQSTSPRFAYTIGLSPKIGAELVLAGAAFYTAEEVKGILNAISAHSDVAQGLTIEVRGLGSFYLSAVDDSWSRALLLGALDFYNKPSIPALQVNPDEGHWTIDVPDLSKPRADKDAPAWRWLDERWTMPVPAESTAITNIAALKGERVTEAARWETDNWELFAGAGPDLLEADLRVVPIGTLLGYDPSIEAVLSLPIGAGLWRNAGEVEWHEWGRQQ